MPSFEKKFPPVTLGGIAGVEQRLGVDLPAEFRSFLLETNGGQPTPSQFTLAAIDEEALVDFLYGVSPVREPGDLEYEFNSLKDDLPARWLPVGHDPGGNLILVSLEEGTRGAVYYGDTAMFLEASGPGRNVYKVAQDFGAFLNSLH